MRHSSKLGFIFPSNWKGWLLTGVVSASLLVVTLTVIGVAGAEEQSGFSSQPQNGASETVVQESESGPPQPVAAEDTASKGYCQPGRYYSMDELGNVRARSDPKVNIVGPPLPAFPKFPVRSNNNWGELIQANALGIAPDGTAYALAIYGNKNGYWEWGPNSTVWIEVRKRAPKAGASWEFVASRPSKFGESWVAGGVDPLTGTYYFGQFTESSVEVKQGQAEIPIAFKLFKVNKDGKIEYVGLIHPQTELRRSGNLNYVNKFILNGDLAFDILGNLHILSGHPLGADLWTVSKQRLDGLNGGEIRSDTVVQNRFNSAANVVGASFDANGLLWISGFYQHFTFNPTTNTMEPFGDPLQQQNSETDLGSCVTPPTLGVEKVLKGPRISDEQFKLSVDSKRSDGSSDKYDEYTVPVTTTGEKDVVQGHVATVVVGEATYKISESIVHQPKAKDAGQVTLDMFKSSLSCTDQNGKEYITNKEAKDDWVIKIPKSVSVKNVTLVNLKTWLQILSAP